MGQIWQLRDGVLVCPGRNPIGADTGGDPGGGDPGGGGETLAYDWSDTNRPWAYDTAADLQEHWPTGVTIADIQTGSGDFYTNLVNTVQAAGQRVVVRLGEGTYHLNQFRGPDANNSFGFNLGNLQGFLGQGADKTFIQMDANSMSQAQLDLIAGMALGTGPLLMGMARLAGTQSSPILLGGVTFQAADQQTMTSLDSTITNYGCIVAQPAPHRGIVFAPNSYAIVTRCAFVGTARALMPTPPFECGLINSQYGNSQFFNCEFDGRRAASIDPAQPHRAVLYLGNNETLLAKTDCWLHDSNTSKYAMNDQNKDTSGVYSLTRCKFDHVGTGNNTDPALNGGHSLGGGTYGCTLGWEDSSARINITDCIIEVDKDQKPHTRHIQFTSVASRNPQGGRLHVSGGTFRNPEYPTLDGFLTIWTESETYWYRDGYATTMDVKTAAGQSLAAYEQPSGWPPTSGQLASLSPDANFIVTQYN